MPSEILSTYYLCPTDVAAWLVSSVELNGQHGYFRFGRDTVCYGCMSRGPLAASPMAASFDAMDVVQVSGPDLRLPFDPDEVVENLRRERYAAGFSAGRPAVPDIIRKAYYFMRPLLPVSVRKHLQRAHFSGWQRRQFPAWPVDSTVERMHKRLLALALQGNGATEIPFIWFWPEGFSSCAMMTHDVETAAGLRACPRLMDIDDAFGIKSAFGFVPEQRYALQAGFLDQVRQRGFDIYIHDLNHDGHLFANRDEFRRRAERINRYAALYGTRGFRSAALYRNADWYGDLDFSYDMSVPNLAHLEAQGGGCCTVMPFFIGDIVELPVTMVQDYTLFHMLREYSLDIWKRQLDRVMEENGLSAFIAHPDYLGTKCSSETYAALLAYLSELRSAGKTWIALPREVDAWWRERSRMQLVCADGRWRVDGTGSERARIAYATVSGDTVAYRLT